MSKLFGGYVAVLDSGVGGLTVLRQLQNDFPQCNYLYLADNAYCPYGTKTPKQIYDRVCKAVNFLEGNGAEAIVLACNTASIFAEEIRCGCGVPLYDVILPTCRLVAKTTVTKKVALLATNATVQSNVYAKQLALYGIQTASFPCSDFVPVVEAGAVDTFDCDKIIKTALKDIGNADFDTVVLGCTHFPLLRHKLTPYFGQAKVLECVTDFCPDIVAYGAVGASVYFTTGDSKTTKITSKYFSEVTFEHIDI